MSIRFRLILSLLLAFTLASNAQTFNVKSFFLDVKDQTANDRATMVIDDNGHPCALIRVQTTLKGFSVDGGTIGIARVEENHTGEIWVYVPATLRRISFRHARLGTLKDYVFPETLQEARTYYMEFTTGEAPPSDDYGQQYLTIQVSPINALVQIDSTTVSVDNQGIATKFVDYGRHHYSVSANGYHPDAGYVFVDGTGKKSVSVTLKPAFGWLSVTGDSEISGADIYIDDSKVGTLPLSRFQLNSGTHRLRIAKSLYRDYTKKVTITDGNEYKLPVVLTPNYADITLTASPGVSIYVNDELKGIGSWTGPLEAGNYLVETKRQYHRPQSHRLTVRPSISQNVTLPDPLPIYGSLNVSTTPNNSTITLDGTVVGTTPELLSKVLIGPHTLVISKDGYTDRREDIIIDEGKTLEISGELHNLVTVTFSCNVDKAEWTIDGTYAGRGKQVTRQLTIGSHSLYISADKYQNYSKQVNISASDDLIYCSLSKIEKPKPSRTTYTYTYTPSRTPARYEAYYDFTEAQGKYDVSIATVSMGLCYGWTMDFSFLDFRLGPIGFRPLNFLLDLSANFSEFYFKYTPVVQVFFPVNQKGAVTLSGGPTIDLLDGKGVGYFGQVGYTIHYSFCASEFFFRATDGFFTLGLTLNMHVKFK